MLTTLIDHQILHTHYTEAFIRAHVSCGVVMMCGYSNRFCSSCLVARWEFLCCCFLTPLWWSAYTVVLSAHVQLAHVWRMILLYSTAFPFVRSASVGSRFPRRTKSELQQTLKRIMGRSPLHIYINSRFWPVDKISSRHLEPDICSVPCSQTTLIA